jgi:branched-chain amino acid transport system substrate-binding protein
MTARRLAAGLAVLALAATSACGSGGRDSSATAPGITDDTITLGGTFALSGPVAVAGQAAESAKAAVAEVNAAGGIDGRKIEFIAEDDQYDPTIAVQQTRKLIDQEQIFALTGSVGTAQQLGIRKLLKDEKVPALFILTAATAFSSEHEEFPYSLSAVSSGDTNGANLGEYLKRTKPDAKVAVLYQNDDSGIDPTEAFEKAVEGSGIEVVEKVSYEITTPTTAPLVAKLKRSGADTVLNVGSPQPVTQAIKEMSAQGWTPTLLVPHNGAEGGLLKDAGDAAKNVISEVWWKDPAAPANQDDPEVVKYLEWMKKTSPKVDPNQRVAILGYVNMQMMIAALQAMEEPTREALLKSAENLDVHVPMLLDDVKAATGPDDFLPIEDAQFQKFNGTSWDLQPE